MHTFGAVFAAVRIDEELCIPRLTRAVAVYSVGRLVNALTARSQMIGGITFGLGQALLESSEKDLSLGRYVSKNLAGYLLPVSADIPEIDVSFIDDEVDERASLFGGKGMGELGAVGIGPAIANAVHHANGIRKEISDGDCNGQAVTRARYLYDSRRVRSWLRTRAGLPD